MAKIIINPGDRFGKWTVICEVDPVQFPNSRSARAVKCVCDCGHVSVTQWRHLLYGSSTQCKSCKSSVVNTKHGYAVSKNKRQPEYTIWKSMKQRCFNPRDAHYHDYGGRGITVCDRWKESFSNFLKDVGHRPSSKHSIDRINNDGNYEPENCQWATINEQSRNKRNNVWVTYNDETLCLEDWAAKLGVHQSALSKAKAKGLLLEKIDKLYQAKFLASD